MKEYKIEISEKVTNGKGDSCWVHLGGKSHERPLHTLILSEDEVDIRKVLQTIVEGRGQAGE